jgi:hypothetical protein
MQEKLEKRFCQEKVGFSNQVLQSIQYTVAAHLRAAALS